MYIIKDVHHICTPHLPTNYLLIKGLTGFSAFLLKQNDRAVIKEISDI